MVEATDTPRSSDRGPSRSLARLATRVGVTAARWRSLDVLVVDVGSCRFHPTFGGPWHASQVGSSIAQNFGSGSATEAGFARAFAVSTGIAPDSETALSSPPRPVDFSADVAASVRR